MAHRLDTVLAELVAPRVAAAPAGDDLMAVRRRRRWPHALVAAAAVCAIAVAGGAVATDVFGLADGSRTVTSASSGSEAPPSAGSPGGPSAGPDADSRSDSASTGSPDRSGAGTVPNAAGSPGDGTRAPSTQPRALAPTGDAPTLRTDTLSRDLTRLVERPGRLPTGEPASWRCVAPPLRTGEQLLAVRLDGRRSTLVLGAPADGLRTARIYSCADPDVLAASTIVRSPAP